MRDKSFRWTAVATYRLTHDTIETHVHSIEEIGDLEEIIEHGPNFECLQNIVITYNFDEGKTLVQDAAENREHLKLVPKEEEEAPSVH